jgi:asparagine synthetase B (glutamine-hydrolysing)
MCGIGGIVTFGGPLPVKQVETLFDEMEARGGDACGVGWLSTPQSNVRLWKGSTDVLEAIQQGIISKKITEEAEWAMLHTRFTTHGSTKQNGNNHPINRKGEQLILTHNGVLRNHIQLFKQLGVSPKFQVDSEVLNAILRHRGVEWLVEKVKGSYSIVWVDIKKCKQTIHLLTNGQNPLVIARTKSGQVVWASALHYLDSFDLDDYFHALPFKQYSICPDGVIRSKWIDKDQGVMPYVIERQTYMGESTYYYPTTTVQTTLPQQSHGAISGGYVFDEYLENGRGGWRKARKSDYSDAFFDEWGRLQ